MELGLKINHAAQSHLKTTMAFAVIPTLVELKFGMDHLCIEPQPYLLMAEGFPNPLIHFNKDENTV
ncbi:hypothetical protein [Paenibacillus sp. JZ16]|uniref:hypothetical protein n=1 Tax=Paenibacillus sp. JZ16 TaxID=1906272 RepID=UPI00188B359E|nr:hypothetical protein [Paenibacillus sp. JZ16]